MSDAFLTFTGMEKKKKEKKLAVSDVFIQPEEKKISSVAEPQDEQVKKHAKCKLHGIFILSHRVFCKIHVF